LALPKPVPGQVLRYSYLWASEHRRGREEGVKDRPCAVVMVVSDELGDQVVTVLPITHTPPSNPSLAVEIPNRTKRRLELDDQPSWIIVSEANRFVWPGPDLRLGPSGDAATVEFGYLPKDLFEAIREKLIHAIQAKLVRVVSRTQ
jgi:uncharacterized protein YifN (PemK superfamily)